MFEYTNVLLAQDTPGGVQGIFSSPIVMMVVFMVIFWVLIIRPQSKKQKELRNQIEQMKIGDKVKTLGGMNGTVDRLRDNSVFVEIANGVIVEFDKQAIAMVLKKEDLKND